MTQYIIKSLNNNIIGLSGRQLKFWLPLHFYLIFKKIDRFEHFIQLRDNFSASFICINAGLLFCKFLSKAQSKKH